MDLSPYLKLMAEKQGTDLLVTVGSPVTIKLNGKDKPVGKTAVTADMSKAAAFALMSDEQKKQFAKEKVLDFVYKNGNAEFDINVSIKQKAVGIVIRPAGAGGADDLELDEKEEKKPEPPKAEAKSDDEYDIPLIDSTELLDYLKITHQRGGSDLFVTVGSQIKAKIYGKARPLSTFVATPEITKKCAYSILTDEQAAQFEQTKDLDFAISLPDGSARFRGNAFFRFLFST